MTKLPRIILKAPIHLYRLTFSSMVGRYCRFQPTCSAYALEAIDKYGAIKGSWLTLKRLAVCHPIKFLGGRSGYDPVP
jgi:putative membrane protein insertion efficiency factor